MQVITDPGFELRIFKPARQQTSRKTGKPSTITIFQAYYRGRYLGQVREVVSSVTANLGRQRTTGTAVSWYVERF